MTASVHAVNPVVGWLIAGGAVALWLHHRGRLRRITRSVWRLGGAVVAVVLAATISTSAVAITVAVIACLAVGQRHTRRHTQIRRWFQHGYDRGRRTQYRRRGRRPTGKIAYPREWPRQRAAALERANYRCAIRGCVGAPLEVHHNNGAVYHHLSQAKPSDLTVLCVGHHRIVSDLHQHRGYTIEAATARVLQGDVYAA